ncbi:MAG: zinc ribbon domain-containing protein [Burkholderiales bacterium]|nr:zinc ribbon domain-containing protein [Burkholderiales bacterium]
MALKCPKCGHPRALAGEQAAVCAACGLVFAKWVQRVLGQNATRAARSDAEHDGGEASAWREILLPRPARVDPMAFYARCALYAAFFVWGWYFIGLDLKSNEIGDSFLHRVNLVFHEAGHVLFMPFGSFMATLGGTLGQLLMPLVALGALLYKNRDAFGASLCLWWLGQSVMDTAPYINDARDLQLMLLGGGTGRDRPGMHDWENILLDLGLIEHERRIAAAADRLGEALVLLALLWGALLLYRQFQGLERGEADG